MGRVFAWVRMHASLTTEEPHAEQNPGIRHGDPARRLRPHASGDEPAADTSGLRVVSDTTVGGFTFPESVGCDAARGALCEPTSAARS